MSHTDSQTEQGGYFVVQSTRGAGALDEGADTRDGAQCADMAGWVTETVRDDPEVTDVRVRLAAVGRGSRAVGQVNLVRARKAVRVQALGDSPRTAARLLIERLARHMWLSANGFRPRPWPDPLATPVPAPTGIGEDVSIRRRKEFELEVLSPLTAIGVLDARDYEAHLFIDEATGLDAVVYRGGPNGYRLMRTGAAAPPEQTDGVLVTNPRPAPPRTERLALERLAASGDTLMFFTEKWNLAARGVLLYARYAGGYGLVRGTR